MMSNQVKGYIHVYTGNGKGKTTAALGLALRAAGAGKNVKIIQFMKGQFYSELNSIKRISNISLEQYGSRKFCYNKDDNSNEHRQYIEKAYNRSREIIQGDTFDLVILDEILVAACLGLLEWEAVFQIIEDRPQHLELVLTGRGASKEVIERADLVTEMKEVKHYYQLGVEARPGIEK